MLEVDAKVVAPDELARRVQDVLARTDTDAVEMARPRDATILVGDRLAATTQRVQGLQHRLGEIQAPAIPETASPVGKAKRFSKRAIRKVTRWYVEPRWETQTAFDVDAALFASEANHALRKLDDGIVAVHTYSRRVADRARILGYETTNLTAAIAAAREATEDVRFALGALQNEVDALDQTFADKAEVTQLRSEVAQLLARLGAASAAGADLDYVAFEERFRGSSDQLLASQREYVRFFPGPDVSGAVVDIGCGRGEMVEILLDAGFDAVGVEPDPGMVEVCHAKGLRVSAENGLTWLENQEDESLKGVFCAQVVEHLFTSELQAFVRLSQAKLRVGGVLIMETINPRSLHALSNHFLADTSHIRPVHPETLRFICEQAGFSAVHLVELSRHSMANVPDDVPEGGTRDALAALLESVYGYQDYAIIAHR